MDTLLKIKSFILLIPNSPFLTIFLFYIVFRVFKETDFEELELMSEDEKAEEIVNLTKELYPKWLAYIIAAVFYGWIFFNY